MNRTLPYDRLQRFLAARDTVKALLAHMASNNPPIYINADRKPHVNYYPK